MWTVSLKNLVYDKPARGRNPRTITSLGQNPGQQSFKEVVDMFAERIEPGEFIDQSKHHVRATGSCRYSYSGQYIIGKQTSRRND